MNLKILHSIFHLNFSHVILITSIYTILRSNCNFPHQNLFYNIKFNFILFNAVPYTT